MKRAAHLLAITALTVSACAEPPALDLIIQGGRVIDGTGSPARPADVAVADGRIVEVGDLSSERAERVIQADGLVLSPGFIDMMGGSSLPLLRDAASAESKLRQGITTMLVGEGGSVAPQSDDTRGGPSSDITWSTFDEYFARLGDHGIALNVVHNVGAAQVRRIIVGDTDAQPTTEQLTEMKALVAQAMQDGAVGLSTALIYPPGSYATTEEIIELAKTAAEYGGVYFTHMRNESGGVIEAIEEAIRVGREAGLPVHIYHLKAAGEENWPLMARALELIATARGDGLAVTADIYPYIRNGIGLGSFIHPRHYAQGADAFIPTLADLRVRSDLRREIETDGEWENWYRHVGQNWDNVLISRVGSSTDPSFVGRSIQEVAEARDVDVWDAFLDLVQQGGTGVNPQSMNEEQKHLAMRAPFICFDNDAAPTTPSAVASAHPRAFGAFPRVLAKYVREEDVISVEEAVRKLTSLPAGILQLGNRGRVEPGMAADLILFDPDTVQDRATFTDPLSYSTGIDYVIVNGELVIDDGQATSAKPGAVIRHGR